MTSIAIVGGGFSGTLLALHLLRRCPSHVTITLIEKAVRFGRGAAYATGNPSHLLNVPAGRMSAFHDRPRDFLDFLEQAKDPGVPTPITEQSFVPRRVFGAYVRYLLNRELKSDAGSDRLTLIRGEARGIDPVEHRMMVRLDRQRSLSADLVVLAVGNFPPEPPPVSDPGFFDTELYRPDPWAANALTGLDPNDPVLLIGTGLTMIDAFVSLLDQGHCGRIFALSRRGLLPQQHTPSLPPSPRREAVPTALVELTRFLRRESARAVSEGAGWQAIVDELRPFTLDVWADMSQTDRARFIRHLRPWWEIHRHRLAPAVADRVRAAIARGQLRVCAGRIRTFDRQGDQVEVSYRKRALDRVERLSVARVVNCSGPSCDYDRIPDPLLRNLLESGLVRPDSLHLGLDVTSSCALKDSRGAISGRLFAVGPVTKGAFWEMTAVPDIRRQCEYLAAHLGTLAKPASSPARRPWDAPRGYREETRGPDPGPASSEA